MTSADPSRKFTEMETIPKVPRPYPSMDWQQQLNEPFSFIETFLDRTPPARDAPKQMLEGIGGRHSHAECIRVVEKWFESPNIGNGRRYQEKRVCRIFYRDDYLMRHRSGRFRQGLGRKKHHARRCTMQGDAVQVAGAEKAEKPSAAQRWRCRLAGGVTPLVVQEPRACQSRLHISVLPRIRRSRPR